MQRYALPLTLAACGWVLTVNCGDKLDPVDMTIDTAAVGQVGFEPDALAVFDAYCNECHSTAAGDRHGAPRRVNYDTYAGAKQSAKGALSTMQSGSMPPSGEPDPDGHDISVIAAWIEQGTPAIAAADATGGDTTADDGDTAAGDDDTAGGDDDTTAGDDDTATGDDDTVADSVTYTNDIQPMMDAYCTMCHAATLSGSARKRAPNNVNLDTYADTSRHASKSLSTMNRGSMPPRNSTYAGERPTVGDVDLLRKWMDLGKPE